MGDRPDTIVENAQCGTGACDDCPAQAVHEGGLVNPGLGNPNGELVFVTEEPRHRMNWDAYESWTEYNEEWLARFRRARGGDMISRLLCDTELGLEDVWITDSVKCPTKGDELRDISPVDIDAAFGHCHYYLREEIEAIDPVGIVTLGRLATYRTLMVLGIPERYFRSLRVSEDSGHSPFPTEHPVVISMHWAQRTVPTDEWMPQVKGAIEELVE